VVRVTEWGGPGGTMLQPKLGGLVGKCLMSGHVIGRGCRGERLSLAFLSCHLISWTL
jgi:hypothetical protein